MRTTLEGGWLLDVNDVPRVFRHRQINDAHLLTLARRRGFRLLTFDAALAKLAQDQDVELLSI
jgi:predicted nucleic acid-binding protein